MVLASSQFATLRACAMVSRAAPATWGAHRSEYASWTRGQSGPLWLATMGESASIRVMFAAATAWPGCGRSACRCGANTLSVPSRPSTLIAAEMSASTSSRSRSASARTSCPSMPSVPLIRARPSFSARTIGSRPCALSASAAATSSPSAVRTCPSPMIASATCASGARSPEQPRLPYSWTTGVRPAESSRRVGLGDLGAHPGAAGGQGRQPQQHHRPDDLALDLGPGPCGVGANQAALQLGSELDAGCGGWPARRSRWRCRTPGSGASASASMRARLAAIAASASSAITTRGVVARHAYDVVEGDRADTHNNLIHSTIVHASVYQVTDRVASSCRYPALSRDGCVAGRRGAPAYARRPGQPVGGPAERGRARRRARGGDRCADQHRPGLLRRAGHPRTA